MKKRRTLGIALLMMVMLLTACSKTDSSVDMSDLKLKLEASEEKVAALEEKIKEMEGQGLPSHDSLKNPSVLGFSIEVMKLIQQGDMAGLSKHVHPSKGLRFSPYFYIDVQKDQVFTGQQVAGLMENSQSYSWGSYDGSGEPINMDFAGYYKEFVYDQDFLQASIIGNNYPLGEGNVTDNVSLAYPEGKFIEYHFPSFDPKFEGMDWESLRLIFEEMDNHWYLVGISHGQWTI